MIAPLVALLVCDSRVYASSVSQPARTALIAVTAAAIFTVFEFIALLPENLEPGLCNSPAF